jgi:hypothetical protein
VLEPVGARNMVYWETELVPEAQPAKIRNIARINQIKGFMTISFRGKIIMAS